MKNRRASESWTIVRLLLIGALFGTAALTPTAPSKIRDGETNMHAVRFDAVVELNRYSSHSLHHRCMLMFTRYWVARDHYSTAVVWAEPQSTDLSFVVPPPTLAVTSDKEHFDVRHLEYPRYDASHGKPTGKRGVFGDRFGGYPLGNIRFAEREALAERIYAADLAGIKSTLQTGGGELEVFIPPGKREEERDVARLKVRCDGERIDSIELFDAQDHLLKDISYEYDRKVTGPRLRRQTVVLPERPMTVGFNGEGIKVTLDGKVYGYQDIEAAHHAGGRICTVEYESVRLGDREVQLPVQVTVCNKKDGRILRRVQMMNFKQVDPDGAGIERACRQFAGFSEEEQECRRFRWKYWKKDPTDVDKADVEAITQLRLCIEKAVSSSDISTGEKLRYHHTLMELDRIIGDVAGLCRHYEQYLSTLREDGLVRMTLCGGYGVIETSMLRGRRGEAAGLLACWVNTVTGFHDVEAILTFSRIQLAKKRLWATAVLLEALANERELAVASRFEAEVLRCLALGDLCRLVRAGDAEKNGLVAKVQAEWVSSIGREKLDRALAEGVGRAGRFFALLAEPTESQNALREQFEKIEREFGTEKKQ